MGTRTSAGARAGRTITDGQLSAAPAAARGRLRTLGAVLGVLIALCATAGAARADGPLTGIHKIQHVVVIMQENRSFDNYFGTYPGANGIPAGVCERDPLYGNCIKPFHDPANRNFGGPHGTNGFLLDSNGGKMDGFVEEFVRTNHCSKASGNCLPCSQEVLEHEEENFLQCDDVMGYHDARELPNMWEYAHNFVLQDDMFEAAATWSAPEHNFMVSGWSGKCPGGDPNPMDCVNQITHSGQNRTWTDITYLLHKFGVSWRYYLFEGKEPDCVDEEAPECEVRHQNPKTPSIWNPLQYFEDVREDGQRSNIQSLSGFYTSVREKESCGLPNVSWIMPQLRVSEHPRNMLTQGQTYLTTMINAIMRSPCWGSTAIFLSWDDWGGFYDQVLPPRIDENGYGPRVPGLTISPYARAGYIDHQQLSHDAYLKFIEDDFLGGQALNPQTDGRPDPRIDVREEEAGLGNLQGEFNFDQPARPPLLLSPHPAPGSASAAPGEQQPPAVETGYPTFVTSTTATLNGTVDPDGATAGECFFEYGLTTEYGSQQPCTQAPGAGEEPVIVSAPVAGLAGDTTYHFRLVAANAAGAADGPDLEFTTPGAAPTAVTEPLGAVTNTTAQVNGSVDPNGAEVTECLFQYGTSPALGSSTPCESLPGAGTSPVPVAAMLTGLSASTPYYERVVAVNEFGTDYGETVTFTTAANPPVAITGSATGVTQATATLNATVDPEGSAVSECRFEYGLEATYGATAPCSSLPGEGTAAVAVSAEVGGLKDNTTYHFRILATGPGGTSTGADATFRTAPKPPTVETGSAQKVKKATATLAGTVNPNFSNVTDCHYEYGTSPMFGTSVPCATLPGSGGSPVAVSAALSGLTGKTTYHARLVATNAGGTTYGVEITFTTG